MKEVSHYISMAGEDMQEAYAYDLMVETEAQYFQQALARAEGMMEGKVRKSQPQSTVWKGSDFSETHVGP